MKTRFSLLVGSMLMFCCSPGRCLDAPALRYAVIDVGTLGGKTYARDVNEHGEVAGVSLDIQGFARAFLYSNGSMQDLGTLGNENSEALGLNDSGDVVGVVWNNDFSIYHAFLYANGSMEDLGTLGGKYSIAFDISNAGQVVGWSRIDDGLGSNRAFLYENGIMRSLGRLAGGSDSEAYGINEAGEVVGKSATFGFGRYRAFLHSGGVMQNLGTLQGRGSTAHGINIHGEVVGKSEINEFGDIRAFLYSNDSMKNLGTLGGSSSVAYAINDAGQIVGWSHKDGSSRAFLYSDGAMRDLNDLIESALGWRLIEARTINNAGQIAGHGRNASGVDRGFLLTPLPTDIPDWQRVIETPPPRPTYGEPPQRKPGKDSLIVVTHGWRPDITWVEAMTNAITTYLRENARNNWQVHAHKWVRGAQFPPPFGPEVTLFRGRGEGENIGRYLAADGWIHLHLIGHSAGSALIQAIAEKVRSLATSSKPTLHCTFLDPYVGAIYGGTSKYGKQVDWVDNYFSRDAEAILTDIILPHASNMDMTWLDPSREEVTVVYSTSSGDVSQTCYQPVTSHNWPYRFYAGTIPTNTVVGSEGFGFPLSKEGGNWDFATNTYRAGTLRVLGSEGLSCKIDSSTGLISTWPILDFSKLPSSSVFKSSAENVTVRGLDFTLRTASPAWLAVTVPVTNKVNFISFEANFTSSSGAEGLLSVYWGTNVIGLVDERVVLPGMQRHMFPLPETASGGTRMLGFRLDAFSAVPSSIVVTNVALGFAGVRESFSLSFTGVNVNGLPVLQLTGPPGFNYRLEFSTDLVHWSTIAVLVNTNGTVRFIDQAQANTTTRFYRAVVP